MKFQDKDRRIARAIGHRIRKRRLYLGMSLEDLAREAGIDKSSLCRCELGQTIPGCLMLMLACRALEVTPDDILPLLEST